MPPKTRARESQEMDELSPAPPTANLTAIKKKYRYTPKEPKSSSATLDTDEEADDPTDSLYVEAGPQATSRPKGKAAAQKRARGSGDTTNAQVGRAKKPKVESVSPGPCSGDHRHHLAALENIIAQKGRAVKQVSDRATKLQSEVEDAQKHSHEQREGLKRLQAQLETANKKLEMQTEKMKELGNLRRQLSNWQNRYAKLESAHQDLNESFRKKCRQAEALDEQLLEAIAEAKPDFGDPNKVTDDEIIQKWGSIRYNIERLATACTESSLVETELVAADATLSLLIQDCKQSPNLANYLMQRFIWQRLYSEVFQARNGIWGGRTGEFFVEMIGKMRDIDKGNKENLSLVSRMKHKTAKDIHADLGSNDEALDRASTRLFADLSNLAQSSERASNSPLENKFIHDLFHTAAKLLVVFTMSRAIFDIDADCLNRHESPRPFDSETMESHFHYDAWGKSDEGTEIDFLLSPSLEKIGSADGGHFDSRFILCKALAVTHRNIRQAGPAREASTPAESLPGSS